MLANEALTHGSASRSLVPFDLGSPRLRAAFLHGALAPDMGYVPGVDKFVSDLVHYLRPAGLAHALLRDARDPVDTAFAWGWVTHLLVDQLLHPVVGRAAGETLYGDPTRRVDADVDVRTHVSIEVGIDIHFFLRDPAAARPPVGSHFDRARIDRFRRALRDTYEHDWDPGRLLSGHRRATRLTRWWPRALAALSWGTRWGRAGAGDDLPRWVVDRAIGVARVLIARGDAQRGFLSPEVPSDWVLREFRDVLEQFPSRFFELVARGPEAIPDLNLETGEPAGEGLGHPASDRVARHLGRISGGGRRSVV